MVTFTQKINFKEGMHARPASELMKLCAGAQSTIKLISNGREGNPKSILGIMSLGIAKDSDIECVVEGNDETEMAEKLKAFFAQDL